MTHGTKSTTVGKALEIPSWDLVLKRNSIEWMKREKFPLDIVLQPPQLGQGKR